MKIPVKVLKGDEAEDFKEDHDVTNAFHPYMPHKGQIIDGVTPKVTVTNFPNGGYIKQEEIEPGVTILEMDNKGFSEILEDDEPYV